MFGSCLVTLPAHRGQQPVLCGRSSQLILDPHKASRHALDHCIIPPLVDIFHDRQACRGLLLPYPPAHLNRLGASNDLGGIRAQPI